MKSLLREAWKYAVVAGLGLVLDFTCLVVLTEAFRVDYLVAAVCGFIVGLATTFVLSETFVFSDPIIKSRGARFAIFGAIGGAGLGILAVLMWLQVDVLGFNYVVAKVLSTGVVYVWNFMARRAMYRRRTA